jgi:PAS domain S-box-containing protein
MPGDAGAVGSQPIDPFASASRVRELVEQLPVVVYVDTDELRPATTYLSPNVQRLLGVEAERFLEDPSLWTRTMHPDDRDRFRAERSLAWTQGTPFRCEYRMLRPSGEEVWIRDSSDLVLSHDGERLAWQGVLLDLTDEKRSEEDFRDSEARYRALVERVPAVVYEMGPDDERRTLFVSPHVEAVLGYTRDEWLDQPDIWIELLHPDDREVVLARHDLHSQTGETWDLEYRLIASDGRVVWVHDQALLMPGHDDDRSPSWHGVMIDVTAEHEAKEMLLLTKEDLERRVGERTAELAEANELMSLEIGERRRMEGELRTARERYQRLVENMPGIAYLWDARAGGSRVFAYVSPRLEEVLGFAPDGWDVSERIHPHDRERVTELVARSARTGESMSAEYRYLASDGRIVWIVDQATLITRTDEGEPAEFQGVMLDITARKEAESKAAEAEDRFRALTELGPVVVYTYELVHEDGVWPPHIELRYVSPQMSDLIGYPNEAWSDDPISWVELIHPDDRERVRDEAERIWRTGEPWRLAYRIIRGDGSLLWLVDTGRMLERDGAGRPWRFQGILLDATEEQQVRERMERSERDQRAALDGARAIPWIETIHPDSGAERYTYIGPQVEEILGYTPEELMIERKHFPRMVHPDDRARVRTATARAAHTWVWEAEYRLFTRDGALRRFFSVGRRTSAPGVVPEVWQGLALDLTRPEDERGGREIATAAGTAAD